MRNRKVIAASKANVFSAVRRLVSAGLLVAAPVDKEVSGDGLSRRAARKKNRRSVHILLSLSKSDARTMSVCDVECDRHKRRCMAMHPCGSVKLICKAGSRACERPEIEEPAIHQLRRVNV